MNILETQSGETHFQFQIGPLLIKILFLRYKPSEPDWYEKPHAHSTYELHFIERGNGALKSGGKEYALRPGTFYLTGPEVYHEQLTDPCNPMSEYAVNFDIRRCKNKTDEEIPKKEIQRIGESLEKTKFWFGTDEFHSLDIFEKICMELVAQKVGYYFTVKNCLSQIIINAARCYTRNREAGYGLPKNTPDDTRSLILDGYVYYDYQKNTPMEQIAEQMGISRRQLCRIVRQRYGMSFKAKVIQTRLENALRLLADTDLPIEKIAHQCGFSTATVFISRFREQEGLTPQKYRIKMKNRREDKA